MVENDATVTIENARLVYRNFSGNATMYKSEGVRTFAVVLDEETADRMAADGWNVKCKPANVDQEEGNDRFCFLEVTVGYKFKPPMITMISPSTGNRTLLSEELVSMLDQAEFENVDLIIRAYAWDVSGNTGIKAYLKTMFVTVRENDLDLKYGAAPVQQQEEVGD